MSDSTNPLNQVSQSAIQRETTINANFAQASGAMMFGYNSVTSSGLTWGYMGGRLNGTSLASGTVALTASNTNYIVAHKTTLAVSVSTATTNWNDATTYGRCYKVVAGASTVTSYEDHRAGSGGILGGSAAAASPKVIQVSCSDQTTDITTGTAKVTFRMPYAMTLTAVRASLNTASSSGNPAIDINKTGVGSLLSTVITIDASEKTSVTAATPAVISTSALSDDDEITIDIDTAGTGAKGLIVTLIGT